MTEAELKKMLSRGGATLAPESAVETRKGSSEAEYQFGAIREYRGAEGAMLERVYLPVTPVAKPRMTRADKWKKRKCVLKYREFCDSLREAWGDRTFPPAGAHLIFHLPMPKSWSKKKKAEMIGQPHQQKPDVDNMLKAFLDALHTDDAHIYDLRGSKYWAEGGYIEVYLNQTLAKAA